MTSRSCAHTSGQRRRQKLQINDSWLKRGVTARVIPHQRSGNVRGVWFTYEDMLAIGRMMPELMTMRQTNHRAENPIEELGPETGEKRDTKALVGVGRSLQISDEDLARFSALRSMRPD